MNSDDRSRIQQLFAGRPASRRLYDMVQEFVCSLGAVEIVPRKTQVGFARGRLFAWVWLPQLWIATVPSDGIVLTFGLDHRVSDRRIKECVEPYPGRFTHHVMLRRSSGLDEEVRGWLREAHELAGKPPRRHSRRRPPRSLKS